MYDGYCAAVDEFLIDIEPVSAAEYCRFLNAVIGGCTGDMLQVFAVASGLAHGVRIRLATRVCQLRK